MCEILSGGPRFYPVHPPVSSSGAARVARAACPLAAPTLALYATAPSSPSALARLPASSRNPPPLRLCTFHLPASPRSPHSTHARSSPAGLTPDGQTLGTPIAVVVRNKDQRSGDYSEMAVAYRPSHADATYDMKYGVRAVAVRTRSGRTAEGLRLVNV